MGRDTPRITYIAPQTETEQIIASVWRKTLNLEEIGINDNFFDLGGNSLLTIKVNSQLQEIFKVNISLVEMFRHPTIKALANYLTNVESDRPLSNDISHSKLQAGKERQLSKLKKMRSLDRD
jgi:acyl carrier protein